MRIVHFMIALLICALAATAQDSTNVTTTAKAVGLANPASVFCANEGYNETKKGCTFPDGKACEPWSFVRGKCGQKYTTCAQKGFKVMSKTLDMGGAKGQAGVCVFPDKSECELLKFSDGSCKYKKAIIVPKSSGQGRTLDQYLAEKRAMKYTKPACKKEGETIPVIANPPSCCPGLLMLKSTKVGLVGIKGTCTARCGNFKCDKDLENKQNCPRDCKI